MWISRLAAALIGAAVVSGCGGRPSTSLALEAVESRIDGGSSTRVRVVAFQKIDGQAGEVFGVQVFTMNFTAAAEFAEDAFYTTGGSIMQPEVQIVSKPIGEAPRSCAQALAACFSQAPLRATRGGRLRLAGTVTFTKKESGWQVAGITVSLPDGAETSPR